MKSKVKVEEICGDDAEMIDEDEDEGEVNSRLKNF